MKAVSQLSYIFIIITEYALTILAVDEIFSQLEDEPTVMCRVVPILKLTF